MAWTEQDYQEIVARLMAESIGVNEVPDAESTDDISSLPAYQPASGTEVPTVVKASLELLVAPALEAADKANEAADKAESNATAAQTAANTANEKAELAAQAASDVNAAKEGAETAAQSANTAASNANEKAVLADTAAANANDTAEHPTYIGQDHYVYKWNKTAQAYDKTDIYTKGDAFSIKKVYASVANMEADKSNPDITEGDFVLVNTGDVEDPDNAKLYVKADGDFEFLVDMSGAIGFTGKTPQFSMGTISTLEAGSTATATISEDGVDSDGNPKYKINFAIPRGNPGAPFRIAGEYATLEALKSAVPDGSAVDGFMAVGTEAPYDYYTWVNGEWVSQGKIGGIDEAPTDGKAYGRKNGDWAEVPERLNLTSENLNDINGAGFATQKSTADYTSPENNYPINENGALIFANANYGHSNQIYGSYLTNRWFARGGGNQQGVRTNWKEFAFTDDVLTKTNTSSFTPTGDYQPATKKYVDDKHILLTITNEAHQQLISNQETSGNDAETKISIVFGDVHSFKDIVKKLLTTNTLYLSSNNKEIFKIGVSQVYCNEDNNAYELSFIFCYSSISPNEINIITKRIFIALNQNYTNYFIVRDLVQSDNLTTLTKKTAAEYDTIGSKDANTAYCVTD